MTKTTSKVSRRLFLSGTASVLAAPMVIRASRAAPTSNSVTLTSWGGSYQEILVKYALTPFTEATGIKVNIVPAPDLSKMKAQLLTGNVDWDVYDNSGAVIASGSKQDFWEKLDLSMFDLEDFVIPPSSNSVPIGMYAGGIAWDPKKFGPGNHPSTFAEYFDLKKFPGRRTLRNRPNETLEAALLADGVLPKDIYPIDVDRAFKALDRIKPSIATWITATPQTISLVQMGEVDFTYAISNRVKETTEPGGGTPLAFSFEQNLIVTEAVAVPKGAPNKENAMKLIAYLLRPEIQAHAWEKLGVGPISRKAAQMMSPEARKWVPNLNSANGLIIDDVYWANNLDAVSRRFKEWVLT